MGDSLVSNLFDVEIRNRYYKKDGVVRIMYIINEWRFPDAGWGSV